MDGRIADGNESLDFLETIGDRAGAQSEFPDFLRSIDAVLVGAGTLRWLLRGGHGWPHDDIPTWLISHDSGLRDAVGSTRAPFTRVEGHLSAAFSAMESAGAMRVWLCGGGDVAGQALALDRVDEVLVTIAPTALGCGPSLFQGILPQRRFRLVECRALEGEAVRVWWERDRGSAHGTRTRADALKS